ncbi:hypothetical protein H5410_045938 [Solanum commersonii]|uniref:Uncharacterized protein n=1 Tax=Solanum commersonii TaxID=4109 RepID=A0A9J5XF38_SOLCO|nr:hypothetical protein H5410_045938 [Solanum commersonii]
MVQWFLCWSQLQKFYLSLPLLYDDDTLIFCVVERSQVKYLNLTLQLFEALSGLRILISLYNYVKEFYYPVNKVPILEELAEILCCGTTSLPTTSPGLPLGEKYRSTELNTNFILSDGPRSLCLNIMGIEASGTLPFTTNYAHEVEVEGKTWPSKPLVHQAFVGPWKHIRKLWNEFYMNISYKE